MLKSFYALAKIVLEPNPPTRLDHCLDHSILAPVPCNERLGISAVEELGEQYFSITRFMVQDGRHYNITKLIISSFTSASHIMDEHNHQP